MLGVALIAARGAAARPFTRDAQVVQLAAAIMPPLALALVGEPCQTLQGGCIGKVQGVMFCTCGARGGGELRAAPAPPPPGHPTVAANGGSAVLAGVLRGCGRQKLGALANFVVNWVLGLPLLGLLGFKLGLGAVGEYWGWWQPACIWP